MLLLSKGPGLLMHTQLDQHSSSTIPHVIIRACHNDTRLIDQHNGSSIVSGRETNMITTKTNSQLMKYDRLYL